MVGTEWKDEGGVRENFLKDIKKLLCGIVST